MKKFLLIFGLCFLTNFSIGQSCGTYILKFVGAISNESIQIESIKLPSTFLLHGTAKSEKISNYIDAKPNDNRLDFEMTSHLTSLIDDADKLFKIYQSNHLAFPIVIVKESLEEVVYISWSKIKLSKVGTESGRSVFLLDLNDISTSKLK